MNDFAFKLILKIVDCFLKIFYFAVFIASTADIFEGIAKMEVQSLISDEIPNLN
jgi:hypothetical protein